MKGLFDDNSYVLEEDDPLVQKRFNSLGAAQVAPIVSPQSETSKNLFDNAVLLSLEIKSFGTSRKLKDSEFEVDASKEKVGANKRLMKCDEVKAISKFDAETRRLISLYTLPSQFRSGLYVLPLSCIEDIDSILRDRIIQRDNLVANLCLSYQDIKWADSQSKAAGGLGSLYKESDYPPVDEVRDAYSMTYSYTEFSAPGRLAKISPEMFKREQEKAQACWRNAIEEGQALLRGAFASLIEHLSERLSPGADGKAKIFKNTLVSNVVDFLKTFDSRNLAGDEELAKLVRETADMLSGVTPDDLRKSETVKARVQAKTESIKAALDTLQVVNKPSRKIDFQSDDWGDL